jgi:hypothetical protein
MMAPRAVFSAACPITPPTAPPAPAPITPPVACLFQAQPRADGEEQNHNQQQNKCIFHGKHSLIQDAPLEQLARGFSYGPIFLRFQFIDFDIPLLEVLDQVLKIGFAGTGYLLIERSPTRWFRAGGCAVRANGIVFTGFNPGIAVEQSIQGPQYFRVFVVVTGVHACLVVPQTDGERFCLAGGNDRDFVLEPLEIAKHGNNLLIRPENDIVFMVNPLQLSKSASYGYLFVDPTAARGTGSPAEGSRGGGERDGVLYLAAIDTQENAPGAGQHRYL